nr:zinc finger BED domain-containing protein RICESLEEPER 2-like [Ipomoea batatas]GMD86950.1 zinc finger BED domain-containing protein RICESLEEPER 2-like [Ipomoea batatas]
MCNIIFLCVQSVGEGLKFAVCLNLETKRMQMKWRDTKNKVDSGVYLMQHMESYGGEGVGRWDCSLVRGDITELERLRLCCMKEICIVYINAHHMSNVARALRFLSIPLSTPKD